MTNRKEELKKKIEDNIKELKQSTFKEERFVLSSTINCQRAELKGIEETEKEVQLWKDKYYTAQKAFAEHDDRVKNGFADYIFNIITAVPELNSIIWRDKIKQLRNSVPQKLVQNPMQETGSTGSKQPFIPKEQSPANIFKDRIFKPRGEKNDNTR